MKQYALNKGIQSVKKITLSPEEKSLVFSRLTDYMEAHPAPVIPRPLRRGAYFAEVAAKLFGSPFALHPSFALASLFLMFVVTSSGVAFAAEGALPGDLLYPVKIYITEPVRGSLAVGSVQKAQWEATLAVHRLEEAETLAIQGRLSTTTAESIKANFEKSSSTLHALVQSSESIGTSTAMLRVQSHFESEVQVHAQVLATFGENTLSAQPEEVSKVETSAEQKHTTDISREKIVLPVESISRTRNGESEHTTTTTSTTTPSRTRHEDAVRSATTTSILEIEHKHKTEEVNGGFERATTTQSVIKKTSQETEATTTSGLVRQEPDEPTENH